MPTITFKVGDRVKRVESDHMGMYKGDTATVIELYSDCGFKLDNYEGIHSKENFKKISVSNWKKEIGG